MNSWFIVSCKCDTKTIIKGLVLSFVSRLSLSYWSRRFDRSLQVFVRRYCQFTESNFLYVPPWLLVIGVSQTSLMVGGFRSKALLALWGEETDPAAVRCGRGRLSCCLSVGIQALGIAIPLILLMLSEWSLMWIDSLTLREYQWGSRAINLTSSQTG